MCPNLCGSEKNGKHYASFTESDVWSVIHGKNTLMVLDVEKTFEPKGLQHCDFIVINEDICENRSLIAYFVELKSSTEDNDFPSKVTAKAKETMKWFHKQFCNSPFNPINMKSYYVIVLGFEGYNSSQAMLTHLKPTLIANLKPEFKNCYVHVSHSFLDFISK